MTSRDPHAPLRDDVRMLGEMLGQTLRARSGDWLLDTVERVRVLSKAARQRRTPALSERSESKGEMSEWLKEHAWKARRATHTEQHGSAPLCNRFSRLRALHTRWCEAVFLGVLRRS